MSATSAEKAEAFKVAQSAYKWLDARGVRAFVADSGNGYHLLVPTTPYADPVATKAAKTSPSAACTS